MTTAGAVRDHRKRLKRLRRSCAARLATLDVPAGCGLPALCDHIGAHRGRPIHLVPMAMPATLPCGFWIALDDADLILHEANTSRTHQEHIVAHELAHMICEHRGSTPLDAVGARVLFPDVDPDLVRDMLGRAGYTDDQEQEAEVMAALVLERWGRRTPAGPATAPGEGSAELTRIEQSLTYRRAPGDRR